MGKVFATSPYDAIDNINVRREIFFIECSPKEISYSTSRPACPRPNAVKSGRHGMRRGSRRDVRQRHSFQSDAMHQARRSLIVIQGIMPSGAIVPECQRALFTVETRRELRPGGMLV